LIFTQDTFIPPEVRFTGAQQMPPSHPPLPWNPKMVTPIWLGISPSLISCGSLHKFYFVWQVRALWNLRVGIQRACLLCTEACSSAAFALALHPIGFSKKYCMLQFDRRKPNPGGVSFLACLGLKRLDEEDPHWKTPAPMGVFFTGVPRARGSGGALAPMQPRAIGVGLLVDCVFRKPICFFVWESDFWDVRAGNR